MSTVNLGVKLDLKKIALHARNAEYNPKRFAAVIMRIREPKTTSLIFASGKMVCTGAKGEEQSKLVCWCRGTCKAAEGWGCWFLLLFLVVWFTALQLVYMNLVQIFVWRREVLR